MKSPHGTGRTFLQEAKLGDEEQVKIASAKWEWLCAAIRR